MKKNADAVARLDAQIEETIEKKPHTENILRAFQPILLERKRIVEGGISVDMDLSKVDKTRLQRGVPVCTQAPLLHAGDPWKKAAASMIPSIRKGFPTLAEELGKIEGAVKKGTLQLKEYFTPFPALNEEIALKWAVALDIRPEVLQLFLLAVLKSVLEAKAKTAVRLLGDFTWDKGYCPICGAFPAIAVIKDKIAERWLHCSRCSHQWRFDRILCPYCEHEAKEEGSTYFFIEGKDQECAFVCERCKRYLVTLKRVSDISEGDLHVKSIGLAHLDVLMQDKGFAPVAVTEWNSFQ